MVKKLLSLISLLSFAISLHAQTTELEQLKKTLPKIKDSIIYVDALNRMAMLFYEVNADSTLHYAVKAREIAGRISYQKGNADALNNIGVFFDIKGNPQLAIKYYDQGYGSYKQLKDSSNIVQAQMNLAMVYTAIGKTKKAIGYYESALKEASKLRNDSIKSLLIYNYVLQYPTRFNTTTFKAHIDSARKIAQKYNDYRVLLAIEQLVAQEMIAKGKKQEGLLKLKNTIETALGRKLYYASMDMTMSLGDYLFDSNLDEALSYYTKGLEIADSHSYLYYSEYFTRRIFDVYKEKKDFKNAAKYSSNLIAIFDKQRELDNASSLDYTDYALKENELKALQIHSSDQFKILLLVVSLVIIVSSFLIFIVRQLKRTKKLNHRFANQNRELSFTLQTLEQSQALHTNMMKVIAHDLRHPIGAIYSLADVMLMEADRTDEDQQMLKMIKKSSEDSLKMFESLLQTHLSIDELKMEMVDLSEILKYCLSMLIDKAKAKQQRFNFSGDSTLVYASREQLWRVFSNVIANAIKFSPVGGEIVIALSTKENNAKISVKDEGIGVPKEIAEEIFGFFSEAKRSGTSGEKPYGLGLAISKQIIEAHGGRIWHEPNTPKGTVFNIEIPIKYKKE